MKKKILQFLYENESNNISASAAILEAFESGKEQYITPIFYEKDIIAIYYYKPGAKFMPIVSPAGRLHLERNPIQQKFNIFSAMGQSDDLKLFANCFPPASFVQKYMYMKRPCKEVRSAKDFSVKQSAIYQISEANYKEVMNLQLAYEIEEVLIPGHFQNPKSTEMLLRNQSRSQLIFALNYHGKAVAKAGTNARGLRWDQIGGVFTVPELRGQGLSTHIMGHLLKTLTRSRRSTALFVKPENKAAIKVYKNLGYSPLNSYAIQYYE